MKYYLILLFTSVLIVCGNVKAQDKETRVLNPATMQEDFNYLRKILEETHPGLYMHQSKEQMRQQMDSLYNLLKKPMPFYQFYGIIARLIGDIKCEHTSSSPYGDKELQAYMQNYKLIPFIIYFNNYKAYVLVNRTRDTSIHLGDEILSINHHPIDSLERTLFKYTSPDGAIETSRERILSKGMVFNFFYYWFINRPDAFNIVFKSPAGILKERHWSDSLTLAESEKNVLSNPANKKIIQIDAQSKKDAADPWRLEIIKSKKTAILTVRTFSGNKKRMFALFAKYFEQVKKEQISNLIIDLEDNPGGDEAAGAELLGYLISKPTKFITSEYLITDKADYLKLTDLPKTMISHKNDFLEPEREGKFFVKEETQGELPVVNPQQNRFTGKVYFHINGGTASAASTFAAVAQSNHLGTFVGQETGGAYFGGGSSVGLNLILPNTKITAHTSVNYSVFATSGEHNKNRGVLPDFPFVPTFQELIEGNKSWKVYMFQLIEQGK